MIEETQSTQNQTAQPAPDTQSPQSSSGQDLQGTVNQQSLDGSGQSIQVQSSSTQSGQATTAVVEQPSASAGFDLGPGLLIVIFLSALLLIVLPAWFAIKRDKQMKLAAAGQPKDDALQPAPTGAPRKASAKSRRKKPTRRQRRQQK